LEDTVTRLRVMRESGLHEVITASLSSQLGLPAGMVMIAIKPSFPIVLDPIHLVWFFSVVRIFPGIYANDSD